MSLNHHHLSASHINTVCRLGLGFLFVYHGLVPKILWLSSIEIELVERGGAGIPAQYLSPIAGVMEILLGLAIIFLKHTKIPIYLAASSLIVLLLFAAVVMPVLLIEAFNPVTTNGLALVLCYLALKTQVMPNAGTDTNTI